MLTTHRPTARDLRGASANVTEWSVGRTTRAYDLTPWGDPPSHARPLQPALPHRAHCLAHCPVLSCLGAPQASPARQSDRGRSPTLSGDDSGRHDIGGHDW